MAAGVGVAHRSCELECLTSSDILNRTARSKSFSKSRLKLKTARQAIHQPQAPVDFSPRAIGVLLIVAGLGWLTYVYPPLAKRLGALAMAPGMLGEGVLTLWLLAVGVDPERWRAQSAQSGA